MQGDEILTLVLIKFVKGNMKRFDGKFFLMLIILLSGYFYPVLAQTQNIGGNGYLYDDNSGGLSAGNQQNASASGDQQTDWQPATNGSMMLPNSDPAANGGTIMRGAPPGGGQPIGGVTPVGPGLAIILGFTFIYLLYVVLNKTKKEEL